jgi:hypothetical protein
VLAQERVEAMEKGVGGVFELRFSWDEPSRMLVSERRSAVLESALLESQRLPEVLALRLPLADPRGDLSAIAESRRIIETSLRQLTGVGVEVGVALYADVWGSASVEFMGVTLVAVRVAARARFALDVSYRGGGGIRVDRCFASVGFDVAVKILCVSYEAHASIDIYLKGGDGHRLPHLGPMALLPDSTASL